MKIIKAFEKIGKLTYAKRIPKHEPTSSYYHLVSCIAECMMRYDEHNCHMRGIYAEETAPSSNVNVTDTNESKEIIVHKTLWENQSMDVSESECNIVHKTLFQNNSADVTENFITELKDNEHNKPSVIGKVTSYLNKLECGRNLLDELDVTYQRAFTASDATSTVPKVFYQISPIQLLTLKMLFPFCSDCQTSLRYSR